MPINCNTSPCISIICPIYRAETYLRKCIESIIAQTFKDWELLLIDDGSPDKSGEICDIYATKDKRIKVFHKNNEGVSATREFGILQSLGEYIIHVDPDDWIDSTMLNELYNVAQKNNADMVICDFFIEYQHKTIYKCQQPESLNSKEVLKGLYKNLHGSCWNKLIKRETIQKFHIHFPQNISYCEDLIFVTSLLQHSIKICYLHNAFYHYVQNNNPNSLVRHTTKLSAYSDKRLLQCLEKIITPKNIIEEKIYKSYIGKSILERSFYNPILSNKEYKELYKNLKPYIKFMDIPIHRKCLYYMACCGLFRFSFILKKIYSKIKEHDT